MILRLTHISMMALLVVYLIIPAGCMRQPSRIVPPSIDANDAGAQALAMYDTNKDGKISGAEFDKAPALKDALPALNSTPDKGITAADITGRIKAWQDTMVGRMTLSCMVTRDGKPLEGAEVKFVPEKFLGDSMPVCAATSKNDGYAMVTVPLSGPEDYPGVPPGYYRVEITKPGENIAAKYNTQTIFGVEIAPDTRRTSELIFDVK